MNAHPLLSVDGLSRNFGGVTAVANLSFSVTPGEIKAVIGPNGAGKTTLFNMIAGITEPTAGRILLDGRRIDRMPSWRRARLGLARTFQNLQVFRSMTALENVLVGRHIHLHAGWTKALLRLPEGRRAEQRARDRAVALLQRVGLAAKANRLAGELSFGECKLLELARALAMEPRLLLLDEPAAGLPTAESQRMTELIAELNRSGLAIVLVEHNMRMVMSLSHDVIVLSNGVQIATGTPAQVQADPAVIAAYLGTEDG